MKLFSKKRLQIERKPDSTIIRWWKTGFFEIFLVPFLCIQIIWGIGSYLSMDEIIGLKVLPLSFIGFIIYWSFAVLFILHLIFNRKVLLKITKENLYFNSRLLYKRQFKISDLTKMYIVEKQENFAESPPYGRDLTRYELHLCTKNNGILKIKGLSEKNGKEIKLIIELYKK